MPFRRGRRPIRGTRKRAIWVNIPFGAVAFTESVGNQLLLTAEDWEAQFAGAANETAVLRAVVGQLTWSQTVVGTAGGNAFWGIYIADKDSTVPPTFSTAGMGDYDWLRVGSRITSSSVTATLVQTLREGTEDIHIKAKRRLKSRDAVYIAAQFGSDAASPAGVLGGILRFLVARD